MSTYSHALPGLLTCNHSLRVPLDHTKSTGAHIEIFAREVVATNRANDDLPWLLFLQGGPGGLTTRPTGHEGWIKRATRDYRVLLLDQRGTGLSTPVTTQTLLRIGDAHAIAAYLKHFRADNIVRDAEAIRKALIGEARWSILGQSYGGFCAGTYLSFAPHGLREVYITGGLPPLFNDADPVYRATYQRVFEKNVAYYQRYPEDVALARRIFSHLAANDVRLPDGTRLSARRFQQVGFAFGMRDGFEDVHYLLERAFHGDTLSHEFCLELMHNINFETSPIFAILHEAAYMHGQASRWSAERIRAEFPAFDAPAPAPLMFTGEMVYPWVFDDYALLRPLKQAAELLAQTADWPALYDEAALRANTVPTVAAVYVNDMYVERELSLRTAGMIGNLKTWVTSEHEHNGLRSDGDAVLGRLMDLMHGRATR